MVWNEEMLNQWQKIRLENGNTVFMREKKRENVQDTGNNNRIKNKKLESGITIRSISLENLGVTTFIMVDSKNDFLGFCEWGIREDEAGLTMRDTKEFDNMDLPKELEEIRDRI